MIKLDYPGVLSTPRTRQDIPDRTTHNQRLPTKEGDILSARY